MRCVGCNNKYDGDRFQSQVGVPACPECDEQYQRQHERDINEAMDTALREHNGGGVCGNEQCETCAEFKAGWKAAKKDLATLRRENEKLKEELNKLKGVNDESGKREEGR